MPSSEGMNSPESLKENPVSMNMKEWIGVRNAFIHDNYNLELQEEMYADKKEAHAKHFLRLRKNNNGVMNKLGEKIPNLSSPTNEEAYAPDQFEVSLTVPEAINVLRVLALEQAEYLDGEKVDPTSIMEMVNKIRAISQKVEDSFSKSE